MALRKKLHFSFSRRALPFLLAVQKTLVPSRRRTDPFIQEGVRFRVESHSWDTSTKQQWILDRLRWVVRNAAAKVVTEAAAISPGAPLDLEFYDGRVGAVAGVTPRRPRRPAVPSGQGSLF